MIISASYKTDIPAFFAEWFRNRLRAGFCRVANPRDPRQQSVVSLRPGEVDGFVFWTKDARRFLPVLDEVRDREFPFILHHTVTGYSDPLEPGIPDAKDAIRCLQEIATKFPKGTVVWRYDPIVFSSRTPEGFHTENFTTLARSLSDVTEEVVVSVVQLYQKTRRNLDAAARAQGFTWLDPSSEIKRRLLGDLLQIADGFGMRMSVCAQPDLIVPGAHEARCIDATRLMALSGKKFAACPGGPRPSCGCYRARDIGAFDTCLHGCVYCYATQRPEIARTRFPLHDPAGEFLLPPSESGDTSVTTPQQELF